jgi:hypothetical protein
MVAVWPGGAKGPREVAMRHALFIIAGAALLLAGCTGETAAFEHLQRLAEAGDVGPQIELAHAYADPARFPGRGPTRPDMLQAAKWCYIAETMHTAIAEPACRDVLAEASVWDQAEGQLLARSYYEGPERWNTD